MEKIRGRNKMGQQFFLRDLCVCHWFFWVGKGGKNVEDITFFFYHEVFLEVEAMGLADLLTR